MNQSQQPTTPSERATEFVPVEGGVETTSAAALLITAYGLLWALLFVFLLFSWRRQRRLESRVAELEATLTRVEGGELQAAADDRG
jgi:CcmD family protein